MSDPSTPPPDEQCEPIGRTSSRETSRFLLAVYYALLVLPLGLLLCLGVWSLLQTALFTEPLLRLRGWS